MSGTGGQDLGLALVSANWAGSRRCPCRDPSSNESATRARRGLGVPVGRARRVHRAEIALAVDQGQAHREILIYDAIRGVDPGFLDAPALVTARQFRLDGRRRRRRPTGTPRHASPVADSLLDDSRQGTVDFSPIMTRTERDPRSCPPVSRTSFNVPRARVGMATTSRRTIWARSSTPAAPISTTARSPSKADGIRPGTGFPDGGIIIGRAGTHAAYRPAAGGGAACQVACRGDPQDATRSVFTEMPYRGNKSNCRSASPECVRESW